MRLSRNTVALTFVMSSLAMRAHAQNAENPWHFPDFSCTQVIHTPAYDIPAKVYRSGSSVRIEKSAAVSTLYVTSNSKIYNLTTYPDGSHQCVVMTPDQAKMLPSPLELLYGTNVKRTAAGTEVVEGHKCKVENVVVERANGMKIESKVWEAEDLNGVPVKIESQLPAAKLIAFYRDIVLGTPDKALFTPPAKCTPYEKMGQVVEQIVK
jgi:hypothetical protein